MVGIEELARAKKVLDGVRLAAAVYPNSLIVMALVGMFRGTLFTLEHNLFAHTPQIAAELLAST